MCKKVRDLRADEIELKPCQLGKDLSWVQLLCYKTSRVDMQILTETFGLKWKSEYKMVGESLFCTISVYDDDINEWISRTDCGEKGASEGISEEKAYATSAFKRAGTQFGIGAALYSSPRIFINLTQSDIRNNKLIPNRFYVSQLEYDTDGNIILLAISDTDNNIRYEWKDGVETKINMNEGEQPSETKTVDNKASLIEFCKQTKAEIGDNNQLTKFYKYYAEKCGEWTKYKVDWSDKWSKWNQPKNAA